MAAGRTRRRAALLVLPFLLAGNDAPAPVNGATLTVTFQGLRSARGLLRGCLTRNPAAFPDKCESDPQALKASIPAGPQARMHFANLPGGDYALSILHDENANAKIDLMLGIPKEGVGFSQNPRLRFSAPKFAAARFPIGTADLTQIVRLQYFL